MRRFYARVRYRVDLGLAVGIGFVAGVLATLTLVAFVMLTS